MKLCQIESRSPVHAGCPFSSQTPEEKANALFKEVLDWLYVHVVKPVFDVLNMMSLECLFGYFLD